jgi:Tol biopolymer transport system component/DNA-binding winged helix-turn-helix (wHTH) protein
MGIGNRVRFDHFEIDFATGDVRKHGVRVKLRGQPLEVLEVLISRAGEVVTREEIRRRLWPDHTVVEFDHSINIAVNRIRAVIGEMPAGGPYVETLRGQGYRFLGAVEGAPSQAPLVCAPSESTKAEAEAAPSGSVTYSSASAMATGAAELAPRNHSRRWAVWLAAGLCAVGGIWVVVGLVPRNRISPSVVAPLLAYEGDQDEARFSPDGRFVCFLWKKEAAPNYDLYVKLVGSGAPLRLTSDVAEKYSPVWSPDGREIAFVRQLPAGKAIFAVPVLGGAERRIGAMTVTETGISWSPNGKMLAYLAKPPGGGVDRVYLFTFADGRSRLLTNPRAGLGDKTPVFSPDGKELAFVRIGALPRATDLYLVRTDGGDERRLTTDMGQIVGLTWTPDGREIVFSANAKGPFRLWRVRAGGGQPEPVPIMGYNATNPVIAPLGGALAYTESFTNINIWRYRMGSDAPPEKLIASTRNQHSPQFSPNGDRIVFVSDRSGSEELWLSGKDGNQPTQLTSIDGISTGSPRWSPDGKWIAFDSRPQQNADIFLISPEGGTPRRLTSEPSRELLPSWSRDGKWIYFCSDRTSTFEIWKMPSAGGPAVRITRAGGFESMESPDGRFLYYTKGRRAGIFRQPLRNGGSQIADAAREEAVPELSEAGKWRYWAIGGKGYYYASAAEDALPTLRFFDYGTGAARDLMRMQKPADGNGGGMAVSPDERTILFTEVDQRIRDVMLMQGFR